MTTHADAQMKLRLPAALKELVASEADKNQRTQNAEIVAMLQSAYRARGLPRPVSDNDSAISLLAESVHAATQAAGHLGMGVRLDLIPLADVPASQQQLVDYRASKGPPPPPGLAHPKPTDPKTPTSQAPKPTGEKATRKRKI